MAGYWSFLDHIRGVACELLVAELVEQKYKDAILMPPRNRGYDVQTETGNMRIDAKVSKLVKQHIDESGKQAVYEWSSSKKKISDLATHIALVVLDEHKSEAKVTDDDKVLLRGELSLHGRVFIIPREVVLADAKRVWNQGRKEEGTGQYLHLPQHLVEKFEWSDS